MVSTSKILTVSYGTFSCTLEGFDDSFDTMKAIAEYFRDLASDDRYFGAEPPTPDAEMLARIAEKEIARRVEAHFEEGGIHLRAADAPGTAPAVPAFTLDSSTSETSAELPAEISNETSDDAAEPVAAHVEENDSVSVEEASTELADAAEADTNQEWVEEDASVEDSVADLRFEEVAETEEGPADDATDAATLSDEMEFSELSAESVEQQPGEDAEEFDTTDEASDGDAIAASITAALAEDMPEDTPATTEDDVAQTIETHFEAADEDVTADFADHSDDALNGEATFEALHEEEPFILTQDAEVETSDLEDQDVAEPANQEAAPLEDVAEDDDDSVAARLRRIRSVVARGSDAFEPGSFAEDEHAQEYRADTVSDLDAALLADASEDAETTEDLTSVAFDDDASEESMADSEFASGEDEESEYGESIDLDHQDLEDQAEDTVSELLADAMLNDDQHEALDSAEETQVLDGEIEDEDAPSQATLRARVIKMKRSDFEAALAKGGIEETLASLDVDAVDDDAFADDSDEAILSPEDEADLQSELDAVTAELEADTAEIEDDVRMDADAEDEPFLEQAELEDEAASEETFSEYDEPVAEDTAEIEEHDPETAEFDPEDYEVEYQFEEEIAPRSRLLRDDERPISRLFDETQSHLDTPESARRRSTLQHLRAAVEANQAETKAGSELRPETDEGAYRSDIADVMRTGDAEETADDESFERRSATRPRSRRPIETRPAPLKLVAEQRVDTPQQPIRPRRVSAGQDGDQGDDAAIITQSAESFSDFAEDIGARNLSQLLEAAAAYMSDIEGRVQFSRPMLMGKIKEAAREDFSREDSLKSFGQLLRKGKLQKLKGGRFTVTDDTDFRAKKRDAG